MNNKNYVNLIPISIIILSTLVLLFSLGSARFQEGSLILLIGVYPLASIVYGVMISVNNTNYILGLVYLCLTFSILFLFLYPQKLFVYVAIYPLLHFMSFYFVKIMKN